MLVKTSTDVAECLQHATECELQAEQTSDPTAKQSFLDLAARWRRIAATFEYIERVDRFLAKPGT
jgi:predicted amidophosphoribosyltransferase